MTEKKRVSFAAALSSFFSFLYFLIFQLIFKINLFSPMDGYIFCNKEIIQKKFFLSWSDSSIWLWNIELKTPKSPWIQFNNKLLGWTGWRWCIVGRGLEAVRPLRTIGPPADPAGPEREVLGFAEQSSVYYLPSTSLRRAFTLSD